jgi:uncharacterized protein with PIN domain
MNKGKCPHCKTPIQKLIFENVDIPNAMKGFMLSCPSCHVVLSAEADWMDYLANKVAWRVKQQSLQKDSDNAENPQDDV